MTTPDPTLHVYTDRRGDRPPRPFNLALVAFILIGLVSVLILFAAPALNRPARVTPPCTSVTRTNP